MPPEPSTKTKFERRPGPVRVLDGSGTALDYFQLFYSDTVLNKLVQFTNDNATKRRTEQPEKNKGEWKALTLEEIKIFYGLLIMKDMIRLYRDAHYWSTSDSHFLLKTQFSAVMSRVVFVFFFKLGGTYTLSTPAHLLIAVTNCTRCATFSTTSEIVS